MRVCFRDRTKNASILVGTDDVDEARRIARIWGLEYEGEPVTRTIFDGIYEPFDDEPIIIEGIKVWAPLF